MRIKLILFFIAFPFIVFSQDTTIVFDRPGIADSPYIVEKKKWQLESGFAISAGSEFTSIINPSIMLRKSLWKNQELRITYNYTPQSIYFIRRFDQLGYNIPFAIGMKQKIIKERKLIPETAIVVNTFYPIERIQSFGKSNIFNIELCMLFQHNFNHGFALNYNFGALFSNELKKGMLNYSICLNYSLNDLFSFFIEQFSYLSYENNEFSYDFGLMFTPGENQQIDISYVSNYYNSNHYGSLLIGYSIQF